MKKNTIAIVLGIVMITGILGTCVSKVSADQGSEAQVETDAELSEDTSEAEITEEETEVTEEAPLEQENEDDMSDLENSSSVVEEEEEKEPVEITGMKVSLENTLDADVISVEISTFAGEAYSENLLLNDMVLKVGETCEIGIPEAFQDQELGMYNVRITMADGTVTDIPFVPFLENVKGTFYKQNDVVLVQIRDPRLEAEAEAMSEAETMQREAEASQVMAEALAEEIE